MPEAGHVVQDVYAVLVAVTVSVIAFPGLAPFGALDRLGRQFFAKAVVKRGQVEQCELPRHSSGSLVDTGGAGEVAFTCCSGHLTCLLFSW
ncbi:MAG TPA: hypothetical protein PL078_06530 [Bacillota bacterium]|nr:hypothetical protein [Bacillota bacterium]